MKKLITIYIKGGDSLSRHNNLTSESRILPFPDGIDRILTLERIYWSWFDELDFYRRSWSKVAQSLLRDCPIYAARRGWSTEEEMCSALRYVISHLKASLERRPANDRKAMKS